ncbi:MAG: rane protein [Caproiciproducens sp.]|jgi:hypothetical protein|nr:rane protein [Caproiciproducens sp.]
MISAYWGFVLMAFHLGIHWAMMLGIAKQFCKRPSTIRTILLRCVTGLIAGYGIYAFVKREIGSYMFLQNQFVIFDFEETLVFFFMDYLAIMGLFICVGHYLSVGLRKWKAVKSRK